MSIKVKKLRKILENALEQIEGLDDNDCIHTRCNTYNMSSYALLETSDGFLDLEEIEVEEGEEE